MYKELGYALPHSSSAQSDHGEKIKATHVQPGDLVFYAGSKGSKIGHVGIVIETTDDDFSFIHASLKQGICIDKSTHPYYKSRYKTARRIFDMTADNSKKRHDKEKSTEEIQPIPQPQEEELELPGQTTDDADNQSIDNSVDKRNSVDKNKKTTPKKKESRRERRKREKAEKQRLEKEKAEKQRLEREKAEKKKQENARQNTKRDVEKDSQKISPKNDEQPAITKKTHVVEKGETMYRISKMAGLTVDELKEINGLTSNDLKIGQVLIIEK
jgi:LysM repeat protein